MVHVVSKMEAGLGGETRKEERRSKKSSTTTGPESDLPSRATRHWISALVHLAVVFFTTSSALGIILGSDR